MHIKTAPAWQDRRECSMSSHTSCACRYAQSKYGYRRRRRHHRHPFSQMRPQKPKARQAKLPPHSPVLLPSPSSGPCPPHTPSRSGQATLTSPCPLLASGSGDTRAPLRPGGDAGSTAGRGPRPRGHLPPPALPPPWSHALLGALPVLSRHTGCFSTEIQTPACVMTARGNAASRGCSVYIYSKHVPSLGASNTLLL